MKSKANGHCVALLLTWPLALGALSCGSLSTSSGTETNTNFLDACDADAQCGGANACRCGVCTLSCESSADCQQGVTVGVCLSDDSCGALPLCRATNELERLNSALEGSVRPADTGAGDAQALSSCTVTSEAYTDQHIIDNTDAAFSGANYVYAYGDAATTICVHAAPATLCVEGNGADAGEQFQNWGAGIGLQLAGNPAEAGEPNQPWDAGNFGAAAVRFTLTNSRGRPVRVQVTQVADPKFDRSSNYPENPFIWGGSNPHALLEGTTTITLDQFAMTSWGKDNLERSLRGTLSSELLDSSKLQSLEFQVANDLGDATEMYSFCLRGLEWLNAEGEALPAAQLRVQ